MSRPGVEDLYRFAWKHTRRLPRPLGRGLFSLGADAAWAMHRLRGGDRGVGQLEKNLARVLPDGTTDREVRRLSRAAMRSYMRYFYEAFALPGVGHEEIQARVRGDVDPGVYEDLRHDSVVLAVAHAGNWDLAAAWACQELATVLTVAERLEPPDLFDQFVAFREALGLRVIGQSRGEKVFDRLVAAAQDGGPYLIPLLADRDLSSSGVEADLCGHTARVAAGPAALAERMGLPLYVALVTYERLSGSRRRRAGTPWGVVITIRPVPVPQGLSGRQKVAAHTRAWVSVLGPMLTEHAVDWHMLQPVFDADLDPERLARRHAAERVRDAEPDHAEKEGPA